MSNIGIPTGISGRLNRIQWSDKNGIGGRTTPDYAGTYNAGGEHGIAVEFFFWTYYPDGQKVFEYYLGKFIDENYLEGTGRYKGEDEPFGTIFAWGPIE